MIAIIYARVSSEDQARTGFSLPSQIEAANRRAQELGAAEIAEFADEGVPGDVLERPGLQAALAAVRRGGVSWFICYDPDRLARNLSLQLIVTDQIERAGTRMEFINFEYKNTPEGQLFYSMRGAIAQFEKAKIRERTMRGKRQKAKSGGLTHNPCIYGYTFDPVTDTLTINATEAPIVRMIFTWFLEEDLGPWAIAERLSAMQVPPARGGNRWHHTSVRNILRNQSYTGLFYMQKWDYTDTRPNKYRPKGEKVKRKLKPESDWVPLRIPAIIAETTYRAALSKLENARRWWSGWHSEEYLLSGLCRCSLCDRPVYGASRQSGRRRIRYYVCRGYAPGTPGRPRCPFGRIRAEETDLMVWAEVKRLILEQSCLQTYLPQPVPTSHANQLLDLLLRQLAEAEAEHERTVRLAVKGAVDPDLGEQMLLEQRRRIGVLKEQTDGLRVDLTRESTTEQQPPVLGDEIGSLIDRLPFAQRRQIVRALVKTVLLTREEAIIKVWLHSLTPADTPDVLASGSRTSASR